MTARVLPVILLSVFDLVVRPSDLSTPFSDDEDALHRALMRLWHSGNPGAYQLQRGVMQNGLRTDRVRSAYGVILTCPTDVRDDLHGHGVCWAAISTVRHLTSFQGRITFLGFTSRTHGFASPPRMPEAPPRLQLHLNPTDVGGLIREILANGVQR